jgi:peptide/nickel transport system permease protein
MVIAARVPRKRGIGQGQLAWRKLRRNPTAMIGLIGFAAIVLCALLAPLIAPFDPNRIGAGDPLIQPSLSHWFGTDDLGRDIFSRVLWGGRESLRVAAIGLGVAVSLGLLLGMISGFFGGWVDQLIQRLTDVFLAFPFILLLLSIVSILGPSLFTVMIAVGVAVAPNYVRLVRATVINLRESEYISAARAIGAFDPHIMLRHILPNIIPTVLVYASTDFGYNIMATAGLSFIGLGAQPPSPEWGAMLNYGRNFISEAWWMSVFPGLPIVLSVLFINLLGDGLRDALDPKMR